jgi:hypothetical protein
MIALLRKFIESVVEFFDTVRGALPSLTIHIHYKEKHEHLPAQDVMRRLPAQIFEGEKADYSELDQKDSERETTTHASLTKHLIIPNDPAGPDSGAETRFIAAMSEGCESENEFTWRNVGDPS